MKNKILELNNIDTFWQDVKNIIGDKDFEDYQIKELQRISDFRYEQLKNKES